MRRRGIICTPRRFTWGTLVTPTTNLTAQFAAGQRRAMVELNWGFWQLTSVGGVGVRNTTTTYCATTKATIQAWVDAGVSVTLGLGLHFLPLWVFTDHPTLVRFTDENGAQTPLGTNNGSSGSIDIVWGAKGAELYKAYLADVKAYLGDTLWGQISVIRIAIATRTGEVLYPQDGGYSWRGFSTWAQNGGANLASYARSSSDTVLAGGAGFAGVPTTNAQVQAHTKWYIDSLVRCAVEQQRYLTEDLGYTRRFEYVMPGSGSRPSSWNSVQAMTTLPAGHTAAVGAVWHLVAAGAGYKTRTSIHCSSTADQAGTPADNVAVAADRAVPVLSTAPSTNSWSSARWMQRLAYEHGMQWSAENPGAGTTPSAHYKDTTSTGLLAKVEAIVTAGIQTYGKGVVAGGYWAHDNRLWDGTLDYNLFAAAMQRIANLSAYSTPPGPSSFGGAPLGDSTYGDPA